MTNASAEEPPPATMAHGPMASPLERAVAGAIGAVSATAGIAAVFQTENEVGSGALFLVGAAFLVMATFGLVPVRFKVGDKEMEVGRAALRTLDKVLRESDPTTQVEAIETFEQELAERGVTREPAEAIEAMLSRFERYADSRNPRIVHDALLASGWQPFTPGKSTYIRWVYTGKTRSISLFQNSGTLVAASVQVRDYAKTLAGATDGPKSEAVFSYSGDPNTAIEAADKLRQYADEQR